MARQHRRLPAPVPEILPRERAHIPSRAVVHHQRRIEPHDPATRAQHPVERVVLVRGQRLVPAPGGVKPVAAEHTGERRVDRALAAADAVARVAGAERALRRQRDRALEARGPDRVHLPTDIGGPGPLQRAYRPREIVRGKRRMCVAPRNDVVACDGERAIETTGDGALRIGHPAHARETHAQQVPRRGGVGAVRDDHVDDPAIVLGEDRVERGGQRRLGVASRHDHRDRRPPVGIALLSLGASGHGASPYPPSAKSSA